MITTAPPEKKLRTKISNKSYEVQQFIPPSSSCNTAFFKYSWSSVCPRAFSKRRSAFLWSHPFTVTRYLQTRYPVLFTPVWQWTLIRVLSSAWSSKYLSTSPDVYYQSQWLWRLVYSFSSYMFTESVHVTFENSEKNWLFHLYLKISSKGLKLTWSFFFWKKSGMADF